MKHRENNISLGLSLSIAYKTSIHLFISEQMQECKSVSAGIKCLTWCSEISLVCRPCLVSMVLATFEAMA